MTLNLLAGKAVASKTLTKEVDAMRILSLLVVAMLLVACGDSSPVSPSPTLPQVAGTYTGQVDNELQGFGSGQVSGRMMVTQSGSQVTVALTLTFPDGDERGTPTTGTLTAAGVLNIPLSAAPDVGEGDDDCGTLTPESIVTNFSGNSVRFDWIYSTSLSECGNFELRGTLTR